MKYKVPLVTLRLGDRICIIPGFIGPGCYGNGYRDAYGVWKWLPSFVVTAMAAELWDRIFITLPVHNFYQYHCTGPAP